MISAWTRHLKDPDDIQRFQNQLKGSKAVLSRLNDLLNIEKQGLEAAQISSKIYDSPNWDYRQAHTNGFKAALQMVSKIITLDQEET